MFYWLVNLDVNAITPELIVTALTQALFSLSIGIGVLIMYGAYLSDGRPLFSGSAVILLSDTVVAIAMGFVVFSIVFAFGMQVDAGPGLVFQTLPVAFSQMANDNVLFSTAFFALLLVAALTSAFAILEPSIVWMTDQFSIISRRVAAWVVGAFAWGAGCLSVYSFSDSNADFSFAFYYFDSLKVNGYFDLFDVLTTQVLMPFTALLMAIFAGWRFSQVKAKESLAIRLKLIYYIWLFCIRIVAPIIICIAIIIVAYYNYRTIL